MDGSKAVIIKAKKQTPRSLLFFIHTRFTAAT